VWATVKATEVSVYGGDAAPGSVRR
jgi:hypothetical protein